MRGKWFIKAGPGPHTTKNSHTVSHDASYSSIRIQSGIKSSTNSSINSSSINSGSSSSSKVCQSSRYSRTSSTETNRCGQLQDQTELGRPELVIQTHADSVSDRINIIAQAAYRRVQPGPWNKIKKTATFTTRLRGPSSVCQSRTRPQLRYVRSLRLVAPAYPTLHGGTRVVVQLRQVKLNQLPQDLFYTGHAQQMGKHSALFGGVVFPKFINVTSTQGGGGTKSPTKESKRWQPRRHWIFSSVCSESFYVARNLVVFSWGLLRLEHPLFLPSTYNFIHTQKGRKRDTKEPWIFSGEVHSYGGGLGF